MGVLYLLGVAKDWPGFIAFTVAARLSMCAGFIVLIVAGKAPDSVTTRIRPTKEWNTTK